MLSLTTLAILLSILVGYLIQLYTRHKEQSKRLPPGPTGLPILGVFPRIRPDSAHLKLTQWSEQYGRIFSYYNGPRLTVVLADLDLIKEAFVKQGEIFSGRPESYHAPYTHKNHGVLENDGPLWKEQRRFAITTFRDFGVGKPILEDKIREEAHWICRELVALSGKATNPKMLLNNAVSNVICSLIFGKRFDYNDGKFMILLKNFGLLASENEQNHFSYGHYFPALIWFPLFWYRFNDAISRWRQMESFCQELIHEHEESFDAKEEPTNYIHAFMAAKLRNEAPYYYDFQLLQSVVSMFAAGTETTSSTIRWAMLFMAQHPTVQARVRAEILETIGSDRMPAMSDKQHLPYTEATICEVQRVANLVPSVPHRTQEDTELDGYFIPKDTGVIGLLWKVHRDASNFDDPLEFNPERFLDASGRVRHLKALIPFSVGKRVCLGESLARMELFLFFTTLFQRFRFEFEEGYKAPTDYEHDRFVGFTSPPIDFDIRIISLHEA